MSICFLFFIMYNLISHVVKFIIPKRYKFCKNIKGELVLITGAGNNIGWILSKKLAKLGANLILVDTDDLLMQNIVNDVRLEGVNAISIVCDMTQSDIYRIAEKVWTFLIHIALFIFV